MLDLVFVPTAVNWHALLPCIIDAKIIILNRLPYLYYICTFQSVRSSKCVEKKDSV